jgi:hypothetical protein
MYRSRSEQSRVFSFMGKPEGGIRRCFGHYTPLLSSI